MKTEKWVAFRYGLIAFSVVFLGLLFEEGAFRSITLGGTVILILTLAAVAYALYRFVKSEPDDKY